MAVTAVSSSPVSPPPFEHPLDNGGRHNEPDHMGSDSAFTLARIYDSTIPTGVRVLVDRLWPRGINKKEADLDEWLKEIAPSTELRRWYDHQPARFDEFARRYRAELDHPPGSEAIVHLLELGDEDKVVLLTATRDLEHSGARVLLDQLNALGKRE